MTRWNPNISRFVLALSAFSILALLAISGPGLQAEESKGMRIREGVLDEIELQSLKVPEGTGVIVKRFPADRAALGTAEKGDHQKRLEAAQLMQREAPRMLAEELVKVLSLGGSYKYARESEEEAPEDAIVIEGRFTLIDPGSRAKRWALGFGAGKSKIEVEGTVKNASGEILAEFRHRRVSGIGLGGGDYIKFLTDDTKDVARDLAVFLKRWATGGNLHEEAD